LSSSSVKEAPEYYQLGVKSSMCDLTCDVISYSASSFNMETIE